MSDKEAEHESRQDPAGDDPALTPSPIAPSHSGKPPAWMWLAIGGLAIVALAVVFVLPAVVSEYELPLERRVDTTPAAPASSAPSGPAVSPFEKPSVPDSARKPRMCWPKCWKSRPSLKPRKCLPGLAEAYAAALEQGSIGDEYYRTQDFVSATASYSNARDALQGLLDSRPEVLTRTLAQARQALAAGDSTGAEDPVFAGAAAGLDSALMGST